MKNILCFGDSNTFGTNPHGGRWSRDVRWTGRLQNLLGDDYYVIEDGCGGRTSSWNDSLEGSKNGREHLPVSLACHKPLDLVILMLGTNDLKSRFHATASDIAEGVRCLAQTVQHYLYGPAYPVPEVLIISPIHLGEDVEHGGYGGFENSAVEKSKKLAALMEKEARMLGCAYLDAAIVAEPSRTDRLHMEADSHERLAQAVYEKVKEILG